jgi:hypothetical protein
MSASNTLKTAAKQTIVKFMENAKGGSVRHAVTQ